MDDQSANPAPAGSEQDPVAMIEGILEREENPPTKKPRDQTPEPGPEADPAEPETEQEEPPPEGDEDDAEETEQQDEQPEPEPELHVVKVDGKELQVNLDELKRGYQRLSDYTRKTQDLAATRQQVEAEAQRISAERAHYSQQLEQLGTVLQATLPPKPDLSMRDADPIGYQNAKEDWEIRVQQLQGVMAEQQRIQQQQQQHAEAQRQQHLARASEYLQELVPEWKDARKAAAEKKAVAEHLRTRGYTDAEIAQAADPRAIAMALDAMRYRELMASKPKVDQALKAAPKVVRPGSGIAPPDKRKALKSSIQRSGGTDMEAIAALIDLG